MRLDLTLIPQWVKQGAYLLDLGCGDGKLLSLLSKEKQVQGLGVDINEQHITDCIAQGINVIEQDLNKGLSNFQTNSFDTVVMTQALQTLRNPHLVLDEMLRVGREGIITFPNFGHWQCRLFLSIKGRMPVSKFMPYHWYDTPNIHFCTVKDFEALCHEKQISILNRAMIGGKNDKGMLAKLWPNLFAVTAVYHITNNN